MHSIGDQLHALLYDYSFDFAPHIKPFCHVIEGSAGQDSIELFFQLVNGLFTQPHFEKAAYSTVMQDTKLILKSRSYDAIAEFESTHICLNTNGFCPLRPLTLADMEKANFETAHAIFKKSYSNPAEFHCVIVGNFDVKKIKELISDYLESIPEKNSKIEDFTPIIPTFPKGITTKVSHVESQKETLVRMTFPIQVEVNAENMPELDLATQLLTTRLRTALKDNFNDYCGIDLGYEFPLYPSPKPVWLVIKFCANFKRASEIKKLVVEEIVRLQTEDLPLAVVHNEWKEQKAADTLWMQQNDYWLGALTNYSLWEWSPEQLHSKDTPHLSPKNVRSIFNAFFNKKNYTFTSR